MAGRDAGPERGDAASGDAASGEAPRGVRPRGPDRRGTTTPVTQPLPVVPGPVPIRRRRRRPLRALTLVLLGLAAAAWVGSLSAVVLTAHHDAAAAADAIIVLGAAQYDGRPSPVLRARLDHAIALYHRGLAPRLLVTGGGRRGDRTTEAAVGRRYAVARGVPDSAILQEAEGRSTQESLRAATALLRQAQRIEAARRASEWAAAVADGRADGRGEGRGDVAAGSASPLAADSAAPLPPPAAILVSDPFHLLRLAVVARQLGLRPLPSAAPNSPIGASSRLAWEYYVRESFKVPFVLLTEQLDDEP